MNTLVFRVRAGAPAGAGRRGRGSRPSPRAGLLRHGRVRCRPGSDTSPERSRRREPSRRTGTQGKQPTRQGDVEGGAGTVRGEAEAREGEAALRAVGDRDVREVRGADDGDRRERDAPVLRVLEGAGPRDVLGAEEPAGAGARERRVRDAAREVEGVSRRGARRGAGRAAGGGGRAGVSSRADREAARVDEEPGRELGGAALGAAVVGPRKRIYANTILSGVLSVSFTISTITMLVLRVLLRDE